MNLGIEKGDICNRSGCAGIIDEHDKEGCCSCHINPPCSYCTTDSAYCPVCGWDGREEQIEAERQVLTQDNSSWYQQLLEEQSKWRENLQLKMVGKLPIDKIEFESLPHTNFTMTKRGVFPFGTSTEELVNKIRGTFGGRFKKLDLEKGVFEYIAYTD